MTSFISGVIPSALPQKGGDSREHRGAVTRDLNPLGVPSHRAQFVEEQVNKEQGSVSAPEANASAGKQEQNRIQDLPLTKVEKLLEDKDLEVSKKVELARRLLIEGDGSQQTKALRALATCGTLGARQIVEAMRWQETDPGLLPLCRQQLLSSGTMARAVIRDIAQLYANEKDPLARATYLQILGRHSFTAYEPLICKSLEVGSSQIERDVAANLLNERMNRSEYQSILVQAAREPGRLGERARVRVLSGLSEDNPTLAAEMLRGFAESQGLASSAIAQVLSDAGEPFLKLVQPELVVWSSQKDSDLSRQALLSRASIGDSCALTELLELPSRSLSRSDEKKLVSALEKYGNQDHLNNLCQVVAEGENGGTLGPDAERALLLANCLIARNSQVSLEALPPAVDQKFRGVVDAIAQEKNPESESRAVALRLSLEVSPKHRNAILTSAFLTQGAEGAKAAFECVWPALTAEEQNVWTRKLIETYKAETEFLAQVVRMASPPRGMLTGQTASEILVNYLEHDMVRSQLLGVVDESDLPVSPYFSSDDLNDATVKLERFMATRGENAAELDADVATSLGGFMRVRPEEALKLARKYLSSDDFTYRAVGASLCYHLRDTEAKREVLAVLMRPNQGFAADRSMLLREATTEPIAFQKYLAGLEAISTDPEATTYLKNVQRCLRDPSLHIANPLRLDPQSLAEILKVKASDPQLDDRPVIRIVGAVHDHNGGSVTDGAMVRTFLNQREMKDGVERCKFRIEYDEIRGPGLQRKGSADTSIVDTPAGSREVPSLLDICVKDPLKKPASLLVISPHGTHEMLSFSESDPDAAQQQQGRGMLLSTDRRALVEAGFARTLADQGSVLVVSCSAGEGGRASGVYNIGDTFRDVFPQAKRLQIISPSKPTNIDELQVKTNADGSIDVRAVFDDSGIYLSLLRELRAEEDEKISLSA